MEVPREDDRVGVGRVAGHEVEVVRAVVHHHRLHGVTQPVQDATWRGEG